LREWCVPKVEKWYRAAIEHDEKLYHNKQSADFIRLRRPFWTVHESTSLLLGKDPDLIDPEALKADEDRSVFAWFYAYLRTLIGGSAPAVVWKKKTVTLSAKELLATTKTKHSTTTSEAVQFLKQTVIQPLGANEVLKLGQRVGFSHKELRTAREALGMKSKRIGGLGAKGQWVWCPVSNRKS
jgi:hypothetical protein